MAPSIARCGTGSNPGAASFWLITGSALATFAAGLYVFGRRAARPATPWGRRQRSGYRSPSTRLRRYPAMGFSHQTASRWMIRNPASARLEPEQQVREIKLNQ